MQRLRTVWCLRARENVIEWTLKLEVQIPVTSQRGHRKRLLRLHVFLVLEIQQTCGVMIYNLRVETERYGYRLLGYFNHGQK